MDNPADLQRGAPPSRERDAFERFYLDHVDSVVRFAASRSRSGNEVADVVAATFVRAIEHADRYEPSKGSPRAWLLGICANVHADWYRRSARERTLLERLQHQVPVTTDDLDRFEAQMAAAQQQPELRRAMADLAPNNRAVLHLVAIDGFTTKEAAEALGISYGAARVRLFRARREIRGALSHHAPGGAVPVGPTDRCGLMPEPPEVSP